MPGTRRPLAPQKQLAAFLAKYSPETARLARSLRSAVRKRVGGGTEFVYDNYAGLVLGYGPSERPSEAVLSLALRPNYVALCFLKGARLPDPEHVLRGSGNVVRHVRLHRASDLGTPAVSRLVGLAIRAAAPPFSRGRLRTEVRAVSAKQLPRRRA